MKNGKYHEILMIIPIITMIIPSEFEKSGGYSNADW